MRKRNAQLLTTIGHLTHAIGEQSKNSNSDFSYSTYIETYRNRWFALGEYEMRDNSKISWQRVAFSPFGQLLNNIHRSRALAALCLCVLFFFSICVLFAFNDDVYFLHLFTTTIPFWMNEVWMLVEPRFTIWCSHLKFCWIKMIWVIVSGCECVFACMRVFKSANE